MNCPVSQSRSLRLKTHRLQYADADVSLPVFVLVLAASLVKSPVEPEKRACLLCIAATQRYLNNKVNPDFHFASHDVVH